MKADRCPTCQRRHTRSTQANARYWALLHRMADMLETLELDEHGETTGRKVKHSAEVWHEWAKSKFIGCVDIKLPSGRVLTQAMSSTDLDIGEFNDFMTKVEAFANEHGAFLEDAAWAA